MTSVTLINHNSSQTRSKKMSDNKLINPFIAGSISGSVSTILFQPFDLIKTRLQSSHVHVLSSSSCSSTSSLIVTNQNKMSPLIINIIKSESAAGLWKGTSAALMRTVPGVGLYFMTIDVLKNNFSSSQSNNSKKNKAIESLAFGAIARTLTGIVLLPATVLKTRFESGMYQYSGLGDAITKSVTSNGVKSLYSGLWPTLLRDVPYSSLYFMFYTLLKDSFVVNEDDVSKNEKTATVMTCAVTAGILASSITHPFDVLKTRMQLSDNQLVCDRKKSLTSLIKLILERNGLKGFAVGLTPRIMRRSLMSALAWTVFERAKSGSS